MRQHTPRLSFILVLITIAVAALGLRASATHADAGPLEMYTAIVPRHLAESLPLSGYDIVAVRESGDVVELDLVLSQRDREILRGRGVPAVLWRSPQGLTAAELIRTQQEDGYDVWRSWDQEGGIRDELYQFEADHPDLAIMRVLGTSVQDREIIAMKITKDARTVEDGSRPASLFTSNQHAREWISLEVNRRLMYYLVESYDTDPSVRELLDSAELWFVLVVNPDGYQYSHEVQRMWRKNLRDNDGDGEITNSDGVDPNRNFDAHWGWDNEGSLGGPTDGTYRGPSPASEPETRAIQGVLDELGFEFHVNYHSVAELILYPAGWQEQTDTADNPIAEALAGTPDNPAIEGFYPVRGADYYITNGETCEYAYSVGTICFTPELSDQGSGGGFVFPDDEALVQAEFERILPFSLDVARSTMDPARPVSHLGFETQQMYPSTFAVSHGDPQPVQVNAVRDLGDVTLVYTINGGEQVSAPTEEWTGGDRYDHPGHHFTKRHGEVEGAEVGDEVTVWFEQAGASTEPFTYTLATDSGAPVLVLAAEDYTGSLPDYGGAIAPRYVDVHLEALAANGIPADVYDIDAHGRVAPDPLGVLGHYQAVVWYTGDDVVTRDTGMLPGTVSRLANDTKLAIRDYLNQGGKLLYTGKYAGLQYTAGSYQYSLADDEPCRVAGSDADCEYLNDDFAQYYLSLDGYQRTIDTAIDMDNLAGTGIGWWSDTGGSLDNTVGRSFDLSAAEGMITFSFDAQWNNEVDVDYGSFEASLDGETWTALPDLGGHLTDEDPNDLNPGWGLTGFGTDRLSFDLSAYAGESDLAVRLRYASSRRTNYSAWYADNLSLEDASGVLYDNDLESGFDDWVLDGWVAVPPDPPEGPAIYSVAGLVAPFEGVTWEFGAPGETNQDHSASGVPTSLSHPPDEFPQFNSWNAAWYLDPDRLPHTGDYHVYSGGTYYSYQRLSRTVDLSAEDAGSLSFWISHDVRVPWDAIFVEARTAGEEDWTTLPESGGATSPDTSLNCTTGSWFNRFPHLAHYMSVDDGGEEPVCVASGSTGDWHAATGASDGWQQWSFDLSDYAGGEVEVSITYVSSNRVYPGVYVDDVELSTGETTSFEDGWDGWEVPGEPDGSQVENTVDYERVTLTDSPAGAVVVTEDTIFFGFGLEGIATDDQRNEVMGRVMDYFGVEPPPDPTWYVHLPALSKSH